MSILPQPMPLREEFRSHLKAIIAPLTAGDIVPNPKLLMEAIVADIEGLNERVERLELGLVMEIRDLREQLGLD